MNRDDIILMAKKADAEITNYINYVFDENVVLFGVDQLERFAALVAAAERDRCILILERLHERSGGQYNYYLHAAKVLKGEI
jgi:hypothetical protein